MTEMLSMWDEPAEQITTAKVAASTSLAVAAVEPLWPYLSQAKTLPEFESRLALSDDSVTRLVGQVITDEALDPDTFRVVATDRLRERFAEVHREREAQQAAEALQQAVAASLRPALAADYATDYKPGSECPYCGADSAKVKQTAKAGSPLTGVDRYKCDECGGTMSDSSSHKASARKTASWLDAARQVLDTHQYAEVDGVLLDATTANVLVQVHNSLSSDKAAQFEAMPLEQASSIAWKLVSKTSAKTAVGENGQCQQVSGRAQCVLPAGHSGAHEFGKAAPYAKAAAFSTPEGCLCPPPRAEDPRGDRRGRVHYEIRDDENFVAGPFDRQSGGPGSADYAMMNYGETIGFGSTPNGPGLHVVEVDPGNDGGARSDNWDPVMEQYSPARPATVRVVGTRRTAEPQKGAPLEIDGVEIRTDRDGAIGWMSDWGAIYDRDWLDKGWVVSEPHNSGGLGGASYRLTDEGRKQITSARRTAGLADLSDSALLSEMIATQDRMGKTFDVEMRRSMDEWMAAIKAEVARRGLTGAPARRARRTANRTSTCRNCGGQIVTDSPWDAEEYWVHWETGEASCDNGFADEAEPSDFLARRKSAVQALLEAEGVFFHHADPPNQPTPQAPKAGPVPVRVVEDHTERRVEQPEQVVEEPKRLTTSLGAVAALLAAEGYPWRTEEEEAEEEWRRVLEERDREWWAEDEHREAGLAATAGWSSDGSALLYSDGDWEVGRTSSTAAGAPWYLIPGTVDVLVDGKPYRGGIYAKTKQEAKKAIEDLMSGRDVSMDSALVVGQSGKKMQVVHRTTARRRTADNPNAYDQGYHDGYYDGTRGGRGGFDLQNSGRSSDAEYAEGYYKGFDAAVYSEDNMLPVLGGRRTAGVPEAELDPGERRCDACEGSGVAWDQTCMKCMGSGVTLTGQPQRRAVNESGYGSERYQSQPDVTTPAWIHDAWGQPQEGIPMLDVGRTNPFSKETLERAKAQREAVRQAAYFDAPERSDRLEGFTQQDDFNAPTPSQPTSTRPRVMPTQHQPPQTLTPPKTAPDSTTQPDPANAEPPGNVVESDPMRPSTAQRVQARVARLTARVLEENPTMSRQAARALAQKTVATYPEMVKESR